MKLANIINRHDLRHEIKVVTLKYLAETYGLIITNKIIELVHRYNKVALKLNIIKIDNFSTRFYR